jgi:hypothetical protein
MASIAGLEVPELVTTLTLAHFAVLLSHSSGC